MPEPFGLMATGVTAAEDTFTAEDIGQGQGPAAPIYAETGHIPAVDIHGTEDTGTSSRVAAGS